MAASVSYLQIAIQSGKNASSLTFTSQSLGTADSTRYIVCGVFIRTFTGGAGTLSSVTIGGVTATINATKVNSGTISAICCAAVPTGTTGDVVVTCSVNMGACKVALWRALSLSSATAYAKIENSSNPTTGTINCEAGGIIVGYFVNDVEAPQTTSWTGLTERFDENATYNLSSGASDAFATTQTNLTVTADGTAESRQSLSVASFSQAASGPANLKSFDTQAKANIKSIDGQLIANIKSVDVVV